MISRLFPYYGNKSTIAHLYPKPFYSRIIEPFAGSAAYSCLHSHKDVWVNDLDRRVFELWDWLISLPEGEMRSLPLEGPWTDVDPEARTLVNFWLNHSTVARRVDQEPRMGTWARLGTRPNSFWGPVARELVARQLHGIRHWSASSLDYKDLANKEATWFIDPPYQGSPGRVYHHQVDYGELAEWCRTRKGQVVVCENEGADWLPFKPMGKVLTHASFAKKMQSKEVIWTNEPH